MSGGEASHSPLLQLLNHIVRGAVQSERQNQPHSRLSLHLHFIHSASALRCLLFALHLAASIMHTDFCCLLLESWPGLELSPYKFKLAVFLMLKKSYSLAFA
jgi:hypothetical protein